MEQAIKELKKAMGSLNGDHKGWETLRGSERPCNGVIGVKNVAYKMKSR